MQSNTAPQSTAQQIIRAAVAAAGGNLKAGAALGISSAAISGWTSIGSIPASRILPLCELGGNVITPLQILDVLARCRRETAPVRRVCERPLPLPLPAPVGEEAEKAAS